MTLIICNFRNNVNRGVLLLLFTIIIVKYRSSVSLLGVPTFVRRYNRINNNKKVPVIISSTTITKHHITKQNNCNIRPKNCVNTKTTTTTTILSLLQQQNNELDILTTTGIKNSSNTIQQQQQQSTNNGTNTRRSFLYSNGLIISVLSSLILLPSTQYVDDANAVVQTADKKKNTDTSTTSQSLFNTYYPNWTGTNLQIHSIQDSILPSTTLTVNNNWNTNGGKEEEKLVWPMARWPDPILRHPADDINWYYDDNEQETLIDIDIVQQACTILKNTARYNNAVGLAAQQCGINARIIFLEKIMSTNGRSNIVYTKSIQSRSSNSNSRLNSKINLISKNKYYDNDNENDNYIIMINPRIIQRSNEMNMKVWTEECLVLPVTFRATTLRDEWIQVQYQSIVLNNDRPEAQVVIQTCILRGEMARAAQHELDHDRGILLTDHVSIDELENIVMKQIEQQQYQEQQPSKLSNRNERTILAYTRYIQDPYY